MSYTKRQLITQAFEEIGYGYPYDVHPDQLQSAMRRLDAMMATWNGKGIRVGYPIPSSPESGSLDDETNVPDYINEAIYLNLAIRIAPGYGKMASLELKQSAREAFNVVLSKNTMPKERQLKDLPAGAGNKPRKGSGSVFIDDPSCGLDAGQDGEIDFY